MSSDYFLACREHNECIFIADNKGNSFDRETWKYFYYNHVLTGCKIEFIDQHEALEIEIIWIDERSD